MPINNNEITKEMIEKAMQCKNSSIYRLRIYSTCLWMFSRYK